MPRKASKLPKFTGELAKPVSSDVIVPLDRKHWDEFIRFRSDQIHTARLKKMPLLATCLGISFDHLNLKDGADRAAFFGAIAMNLAILVCPGFKEKSPGKWPREIVRWVLMGIEEGKSIGQCKSDLDGCISFLKQSEPELARPQNRTQLRKRARTLRNLIAADRAELKRAHAKRKRMH
jgi:hypothetical protein